MKLACVFTAAAAGLVLASAISDQEHVAAFKDVAFDPRLTSETQHRGRKAIFGGDSREDEADTTDFWRSIGRSTAIIFPSDAATSGSVWHSLGTLSSRYNGGRRKRPIVHPSLCTPPTCTPGGSGRCAPSMRPCVPASCVIRDMADHIVILLTAPPNLTPFQTNAPVASGSATR
jgi:hypothetical protein